MVRSSLVSLGFGLLLAGSPAAAQTTSTSTSTSSSSLSVSTVTLSASLSFGTLSGSTTSTSTKPTSSTPVPTATPTSCAVGLQIFVARGSLEDPGLGRMGVVARNISEQVKGSSITAVDYPATFTDYSQSVGNGTSKLRSLVTDYASRCPNGKMALLGYSQGAQAVGDLVCGTSSEGFTSTADLDSKYDKNIVAIVLYGDPTRAVNQTWNVGTATNQGSFFPRKNNGACAPYSAQMRSWCDAGDRYCANGNLTDVHGSYFNKYEKETTQWVVGLFNAAQAANPGTTTTRTSTSTAAGSTTTAGAATTTSSPPRSGASGMAQSGGSSAWFALAMGLVYLLSF